MRGERIINDKKKPDDFAWLLFISILEQLPAEDIAEHERCKQDEQDHNTDRDKHLSTTGASLHLHIFGAREACNETPGKTLNDGESQQTGGDLVHRLYQEVRAEDRLHNTLSCLQKIGGDERGAAGGDSTVDVHGDRRGDRRSSQSHQETGDNNFPPGLEHAISGTDACD